MAKKIKKIRMAKEAATRIGCFRGLPGLCPAMTLHFVIPLLDKEIYYFLFMNLHFQLNGIVNFVSPSLVKSILTPRSRSPMFCGSANVA